MKFLKQWDVRNQIDGLIISVVAGVIHRLASGIKELHEKADGKDIDSKDMGHMTIDQLCGLAEAIKKNFEPQSTDIASCCSVHTGTTEECKD